MVGKNVRRGSPFEVPAYESWSQANNRGSGERGTCRGAERGERGGVKKSSRLVVAWKRNWGLGKKDEANGVGSAKRGPLRSEKQGGEDGVGKAARR